MSVEILRGSACVGIDTFADQDAVSIPSTNLPGRKKNESQNVFTLQLQRKRPGV